jgi:hypothetical protein
VVVGRVAVGEITAHRGEVSHEGIGDEPTRVEEQRIPRADQWRLFEIRLPRERADP